MKFRAGLIARGFALTTAIVALAMAAEISQDVNEAKPGAELQNQTRQEMRQDRKELKTDR